jgi:hypothetical protein
MAGAAHWRWFAALPSALGFAVALRCVWDLGWMRRLIFESLFVTLPWYIEDAAVTVSTAPRTIHDFGGVGGTRDKEHKQEICLRVC